MAGGGGQQQSPADNSTGLLWGIAAIFAAIGIIWYSFKHQIIMFYLFVKLYEVDLMNMLTDHHFDDLRSNILAVMANADHLNFDTLVAVGTAVGHYIALPLVALLALLAVMVYMGNTTRAFKRRYSMHDLIKLEQTNWPQISPVVNLNLLKTDIDKGPWAMAMSPIQFCKRYNLLDEVRPQRREGMTRKEWDKVEVILRRGDAAKVFALQLGPLWKGTHNLPPHTRALFAVFAARTNADSKEATRILMQLAASSTSKLNVSGVDELLKKHENTKLVKEIVETHAYVLTVMASILEGARQDGVQASADFLWLKPVDRKLWYTLNAVGRQTPFAEVAGIFAHWVAEKAAGKRIIVPMVDEATKALDVALKEVVYKPEET